MRTESKRQTYSESKGQAPFDWNGFLLAASRNQILPQKIFDAIRLARTWVTCACGTQCEELPRHLDGSPMDEVLGGLGVAFMDRINHRDWYAARTTLAQIESRSQELLEQMRVLKQQNPNK